MNESTSFKMGAGDDAPVVNAWGRAEDEDVSFDAQHNDTYDQMTVDQLKDAIKARREQGREIDTAGLKKKSQVIQALRDDDAAAIAEANPDADEDEDDDSDSDRDDE